MEGDKPAAWGRLHDRLARRDLLGLGLAASSAMMTEAASAPASAQPVPSQPGLASDPAPLPPTPAPLATDIRTELKLVAPSVYAYIQREAPGQSNLGISNCGVIAGPNGLLAIDATAAPAQARRFRAAAEQATGKLFDRVVITHHHGDHINGLQFLPVHDIIAQDACRDLVAKASRARPIYWRTTNPLWVDAPVDFTLTLPTTAFSERMTLYGYGPSRVELRWPSRAHTLGDTNVYLPDEKVIFIGDVGFFDVTPLNGSGFVANWIRVCDDILRMNVDVIVPGHGPIGSKADLEVMKQYLILIYGEGKKLYDKGMKPGQAAAEIDLGRYARWSDPDRIVNNMVRLWSEFDGTIGEGVDLTVVYRERAEYDRLRRAAR